MARPKIHPALAARPPEKNHASEWMRLYVGCSPPVVGAHAAAAAESWPTRPLTMVVPFAAGGGTDVMGRIVGRRLSEVLGQHVGDRWKIP